MKKYLYFCIDKIPLYEFQWDEVKNQSNQAKHGVSFDLAKEVFDDPFHQSEPDFQFYSEERWISRGITRGNLLYVSYTYRKIENKECIRIISARKAKPKERRLYEQDRKRTTRRSRTHPKHARRGH